MPARARGQSAFGCYLPRRPGSDLAPTRAYGLMVLTLDEDGISAIIWFGESSLFRHFGLP